MIRGNSLSIADVLNIYLRETGLEKTILEDKVVALWPEIMGDTVSRLTRSVEVKNGMLIVHISSAALKAQLFECRFELVKKINDAVGGNAIRDVRILG